MMTWIKAKELLSQKIFKGLDLDPQHTYKIVTECGNNGFKIRVGNNKIAEISYLELEKIFEKSKSNNGIYKNSVLKDLDIKKLAGTPCLVQAVGKLFVFAGVMTQKSAQIFNIEKVKNDRVSA